MRQLHALWLDESGFVISSELVIIVTVAVIGLIVGFVAIRDAVVQELGDVAAAIGALDQSYSYNGVSNTCSGAFIKGARFADATDSCDLSNVQTPAGGGAIRINVIPSAEGE